MKTKTLISYLKSCNIELICCETQTTGIFRKITKKSTLVIVLDRPGRVNITRPDLINIGKIVYGDDKDTIIPVMFINVMSMKLRSKNIKDVMTYHPLDDISHQTDKLMDVLYKKYQKENDDFKKDVATPLSLGGDFGTTNDLFSNQDIKHTKHQVSHLSNQQRKIKTSFDNFK